uniref:Uncharacterized protein n=1 Tax=Manihot esculenta TaxID=3983 RepID=A0A2C9VBE7_MANES
MPWPISSPQKEPRKILQYWRTGCPRNDSPRPQEAKIKPPCSLQFL